MRKEECEWIRNNLITIQAAMLREPRFQISLRDLLRLYSDYGTMEELEKCLRELERTGVLRKKASDTYVFINEVKRRLSDLNIENRKLIDERNQIGKELDALNRLWGLWLDDLPPEPSSSPQPGVLKYFISVFWQSKSNYIRQKLLKNEDKRKLIEKDIYELKRVLEEPQ